MTHKALDSRSAWERYFEDVGLRDDLVDEYSAYAERLLARKLPVIFDWHHLAALLGVSTDFLASVHSAASYHYREFDIPKRSGGRRTIQSPRTALKKCQRWVLSNIVDRLAVHKAAKGFVRKTSVVSHASCHVGNSATLKMDFKDFFPTIRKRRVVALFRSIGYSHSVSLYLASICCLEERLPQGAPTSPALSNVFCRRFDARISALAKKRGWVYSRYADDLAITGAGVDFALSRFIARVAADEGFVINERKTRVLPSGSRRIITGISVGGDSVAIPRAYKRALSQEVHYVTKYGVLSHIAKLRRRDPLLLDRLIGRVGFWAFVEPACDKARELQARLLSVLAEAR